MATMLVHPSLFPQLLRASFVMNTERRYSIILERSAEVLLNNALMTQVEAFWDANDARYFGLRIEDEHSAHARVMVTDELPEDDGE
ncbi:hypothetical protein ACVI9W_003212 [Pseudomonas sp. 210_17 TE3656]